MVPQTPWIQRSFRFDFPTGYFPVIFSRLEGTIFRLYSLLSQADEETCSFASHGWSVKEHVGHLTDLELLWWERLRDYSEGKTTLTAADMTNARTTAARHNEKRLEHLLEEFSNERQKMLEVVYDYDESMLNRTALHPRLQQPMRLIDALFFVAEHDDHHISTLSNLLRRPPPGTIV